MKPRLLAMAILAGILCGLGWSLTAGGASARPVTRTFGLIKDWKIFDFFEPDPSGKKGTNQLKMLLHGAVAHPQKDDTILVDQMWLGSFDRDGHTNLVATAPQSLVNPSDRVVSSPGNLEIQTAQGQLFIQGQGFYCRLTNLVLILSNNVETLLHRTAMGTNGSSSKALDRLGKTPEPGGTNSAPAPLRITSERFLFDQASNYVVYTGNVLAQDDRMALTCRQLTIHLSTNGGVEQILAEHDVMVMGFTNQHRAMGDRAVYRMTGPEEETVALYGAPARWEDGVRQGQGTHFIYEPKQDRLTAPGPSLVTAPSVDFLDPSVPASGTKKPRDRADTNAPVDSLEIRAEWMQALLPSTNHAGRTLVASNGVVVIRPLDQSQITADRAFYSDQTGILTLDGNAFYQSPQRQIQGRAFYVDQSNRTFTVRHEARLRMPLATLGSQGWVAGMATSGGTNQSGAPAPWVEVYSDDVVYRTNRIQFERGVRVIVQQGQDILGRGFGDALDLYLSSNKVERAEFIGQVRMEQPAVRVPGRAAVEKRLECEWYTVWLGAGGQVSQMTARTNVLIRQMQYPAGSAEPVRTDLRAGEVTAWFAQHTNAVERIVAERDVVIDQATGKARGQQAVYTQQDDSLVLSGDVTLESPRGVLSAPAAVLRHFGLWPGKLNQLDIPLNPRRPVSGTP